MMMNLSYFRISITFADVSAFHYNIIELPLHVLFVFLLRQSIFHRYLSIWYIYVYIFPIFGIEIWFKTYIYGMYEQYIHSHSSKSGNL